MARIGPKTLNQSRRNRPENSAERLLGHHKRVMNDHTVEIISKKTGKDDVQGSRYRLLRWSDIDSIAERYDRGPNSLSLSWPWARGLSRTFWVVAGLQSEQVKPGVDSLSAEHGKSSVNCLLSVSGGSSSAGRAIGLWLVLYDNPTR